MGLCGVSLSHFKLSFFEDEYCGLRFNAHYDITLPDFLCIIKAVRDSIVHDGKYWSMQFFAHDEDSIWLTSMKADKKMIQYKFHRTDNEMIKYHFEATLNYDRFIFYFVEACINYIRKITENEVQCDGQ